jgi:hypothetical protein
MNFVTVVLISVSIVIYLYMLFNLAAYFDNFFYEKGANMSMKTAYRYAVLIFFWPVTCWFKKLWEIE